MIDLANTFLQLGPARSDEALRLYEQAAAIFGQELDFSARARVLMNRAILHHNSGRMEAAVADLDAALAAAESSRSRIWIGYCQLNLAQFRAELHDPPGARVAIDRAASMLDPLGDRLAHQQAQMIRGMIAEEEGRLGSAYEHYHVALQEAAEIGLELEVAEMRMRLASLALRRGSPIEAKDLLAEADRAGLRERRGDLKRVVEDLDARIRQALAAPSS
jgi:tetratricopeptide (TPR) repeat protein